MGCGCNKNKKEPNMALSASFTEGSSLSKPADRPRRFSMPRPGDYENSLGCAKCYAKHLAKAIVELGEYAEDSSRYEELSLCMGDIACAEDHAGALGLEEDKEMLRKCRDMIWETDNNAVRILRQLSVKATKNAVFEAEKDRRERAYRLAAEAERVASENVSKEVEAEGAKPALEAAPVAETAPAAAEPEKPVETA